MRTAVHTVTKRFHAKLIESNNNNEYNDVYFQVQLETPFSGNDTCLSGFCNLTGKNGSYSVFKDINHLFDMDIDGCGVIRTSRNIDIKS